MVGVSVDCLWEGHGNSIIYLPPGGDVGWSISWGMIWVHLTFGPPRESETQPTPRNGCVSDVKTCLWVWVIEQPWRSQWDTLTKVPARMILAGAKFKKIHKSGKFWWKEIIWYRLKRILCYEHYWDITFLYCLHLLGFRCFWW